MEDDSKDHIHDMIVDYGGDTTILIHEGKKSEELFIEDGTIPDLSSTENSVFKIVQTIIKH